MSIEQILYTAQATAVGGREGHAASSDKALDIALSTPAELGALAARAPTRNSCSRQAIPRASWVPCAMWPARRA